MKLELSVLKFEFRLNVLWALVGVTQTTENYPKYLPQVNLPFTPISSLCQAVIELDQTDVKLDSVSKITRPFKMLTYRNAQSTIKYTARLSAASAT